MKPVIIYGMSHAGFRIASCLRETGAAVTAAVQQGSEFIARLQQAGIPVRAGDLRDFSLMRELGLDGAQSVIFPSEDDLFNLNAALHAVELNPAVHVVLRLFNTDLGRKLEQGIRNVTVLSVSQLASSSFAASALIDAAPLLSFEEGDDILHIYRVDGRPFAGRRVSETEQERELRILCINGELFPQPHVVIAAEDTVTVFSRFAEASALCGAHACSPRRDGRKAGAEGRNGLHFFRQLDKVLLWTTASLLVVVIASVLFFHAAERLSLLDASYFVITVLTTTGFGDISLKDSAALSKVAGMGLMLAGMSLMAMLFAIISDSLLKKRLDLFLGRRRIRLHDHVILCGVGDVGFRVLEDLLRMGEPVVVIEKNPDARFIDAVRQRHVPLIISDATQEETLQNANIHHAKAIICATDDDLRNLETGLKARGLQDGIRVVLRIFEKELAERIQRHFGIHVALSSSAIAAPAFMSAARDTGTIGLLELNGRRFQVKASVIGRGPDITGPARQGELKLLMVVRPDGQIRVKDLKDHMAEGARVVYLTAQHPAA